MDLFIDTNVLLDHFGNRAGFAVDARKILAMGLFKDARLWAAPQSFNDMFYILRKAFDSHAVQDAFSKGYTFINVCSVDSDDMALAARRSWNDMEDCLIAICAEKVRADYLVTRDAKGFSQSKVEAISPQELIAKVESTFGISYGWIDAL